MCSLLFYTVTLQPSLAWGDGTRLQREVITAESFILAEMVDIEFAVDPYPFARLGVAAWDHPLYVMLGHALVRAAPPDQSLWLVNFISALFAAGTVTLLYLLAVRHTGSHAASLLAAAALAVSHTFWWHAVTPEVYTLFTFLLLLAIYLIDSYERGGRFATLLAAAFFLGLGISNHLLAVLALPALLFYLLLARFLPQTGDPDRATLLSPHDTYAGLHRPYVRSFRQAFWLLLAFIAGLLPYLVQFMRLLRTFSIAEIVGPAAGVTFLKGSLAVTPGTLLESVASYLIFLFYNFLLSGVFLGVYGWWFGRRTCPALWAKAFAFYLVYLLFGLFYRVSDQFAFFLGAHLFWSLAIAMGIAHLATRAWPASQRRRLLLALALPILLTPLLYNSAPALLRTVGINESEFGVPQIGSGVRDGLAYYVDPNKRGDVGAVLFGYQTLANLPPDAVVIAEWYTDTDEYFVLRYFAVVEKMRPDITLLGWPTTDPFIFDPTLVTGTIAAQLPDRPVYLASLSDQFYNASALLEQYCLVPEHNLYRVYPNTSAGSHDCLPPLGRHALMPRSSSILTVSSKCLNDQPKQSSLQTTSMSP